MNAIDNLIEKGFPRFIVITGQKGQGKTELANYITYKDDVFENNTWLYSNEYETEIKDIEVLKEIADLFDISIEQLISDPKNETYDKVYTLHAGPDGNSSVPKD